MSDCRKCGSSSQRDRHWNGSANPCIKVSNGNDVVWGFGEKGVNRDTMHGTVGSSSGTLQEQVQIRLIVVATEAASALLSLVDGS